MMKDRANSACLCWASLVPRLTEGQERKGLVFVLHARAHQVFRKYSRKIQQFGDVHAWKGLQITYVHYVVHGRLCALICQCQV